VQTLFASLSLSTPYDIRTYAIVLLAYTLGLRPVEIGTLTLDDISFRKREVTLSNRKGLNPVTLLSRSRPLRRSPLTSQKPDLKVHPDVFL